ncbi:MAG: hypothetical protein D3918_16320, partial [Candidatus Electrothrix sp. AX2]|nr:hypothetical protein [Candidatus Electrothrix gigas]
MACSPVPGWILWFPSHRHRQLATAGNGDCFRARRTTAGPLQGPTARVDGTGNALLPPLAQGSLNRSASSNLDGLIRAGLAHYRFVAIHPFDDGNGRIARAITDMALAQDENNATRFYTPPNQA